MTARWVTNGGATFPYVLKMQGQRQVMATPVDALANRGLVTSTLVPWQAPSMRRTCRSRQSRSVSISHQCQSPDSRTGT